MSDHLTRQEIEDYHRRVLKPAELLAADEHLSACAACRQLARESSGAVGAFAALNAELRQAAEERPLHLTYEQVAALVDEDLNEIDREMLESHLAWCAPCAEEVADLRAFSTSLGEEQRAREAITRSAATAPGSTPMTFRERALDFLRAPARLMPLRFASVAVLASLLVAVVIMLWLAWTNARPPQELAGQPASPSPAQNSTPGVSVPAPTQEIASADSTPSPAPSPSAVPSPQIVAELKDEGRQIALDNQGRLTGLDSLPAAELEAVKSTLSTQRLQAPRELALLAGRRGTLLGGPGAEESFALTAPVGIVVNETRPTYRWASLSGATGYVVSIYDANFNRVATSPQLSQTVWRQPTQLPRGRIYTWQVTALKDGREIVSPAPPAPEARFKVLEQARADELARAERSASSSHLLRGILYTRAGLLEDAEREFRELSRENPRSTVARRLLMNVRAMRRTK